MYTFNFDEPKHAYFIGIGGISMSGLALLLRDRGFNVSGSDWNKSEMTTRLENAGITIYYGEQRAENIKDDIDFVVYTAAVKKDNPEYMEAIRKNIPLLTRAEFLGQIMNHYDSSIAVAGTHGKTTTTSMLSEIQLNAETDPTILNGGILNSIKSNIRIGHSENLLIEACEYTNSFHSFYPRYSVILNIEEDHLDFFKDINDIRDSFVHFANNTKNDGIVFINGAIDNLIELTKRINREVVTFGINGPYDYHGENIKTKDDGFMEFDLYNKDTFLEHISLSLPGEYNVLNAVAASSVCHRINLPLKSIKDGLSICTGSKRRFEKKGTYHGATIIDDYAHHPSEIRSALTAAKACTKGKVICVFQPHTYTRTKALFNDFIESLSLADEVILAEIYPARETDTLGMSSKLLCDELMKKNISCSYFPTFEEIKKFISKKVMNDDLLITMGAGNVVNIGDELLKE